MRSPAAFRGFLLQNDITWVIAQSPELAELARRAGLDEAFRSDSVTVFRQVPMFAT
jgi:hypothetical protein